ncbi:BCCT family transporter [Lysobacter sp. BMK333-48F3]|uniref:BCCT family transporter n=1 Tax=Lysobacter sp. BMK333-48F3 TaxID=2867962 RepID=UPI001C8C24A9|nr:BCCT family transporter [Lysobacter sp. BMK333-48F3]MBX9403908.1 BCCT family transporter [Lysobacter sp. BMK333-48F3]
MVFRVSIVLLALLVAAGVLAPDAFNASIRSVLAPTLAHAGWLYLLIVFAVLLFLLYLCFGRFAQLRIGGDDAEPEFSRLSWLSMLFAAGMGIGLVFWGAAEPLSHYLHPPEGLAAQSQEAARASMRYAFFHWGLHPWAVYALVGLAMAWFQFNRRGRGQISDLLEPVIPIRHRRWAGPAVDIAAVVATAIGVATTLGFGTIQISAGLARVFGLNQTPALQLCVVAVAFVLYMASSLTGLHRGIKWMSNLNLALAAALLAFVLVCGPTGFVFETFTTTLGSYINQLPNMSLRMAPFSRDPWVGEWTIFYWAWWIAWAPFVGSFIARISRGRRVREFVLGVVLVPALMSFLWFSSFGGSALWAQMFGGADLAGALAQGYEQVLFALLEQLPAARVASIAAIALLMMFFVTSADSATLVLASMSSQDRADPPLSRRALWGAVQALIAVALLLAGGLDALQGLIIVAALPFALLLVLVLVALYRALDREHRERQRLETRQRHAMQRWLAREAAD